MKKTAQPKDPMTCAHCSNTFVPFRSTAIYCGVNCRTAAHKKAARIEIAKIKKNKLRAQRRRDIRRLRRWYDGADERFELAVDHRASAYDEGYDCHGYPLSESEAADNVRRAKTALKSMKTFIRGEAARKNIPLELIFEVK